MAHTPPELVMVHLNIDKATLDAFPKAEGVVLPSRHHLVLTLTLMRPQQIHEVADLNVFHG